MRNPLRVHLRSLFTRLCLIMAGTVIVINVAIYGLFLRFQYGSETSLHRNLVQYAHFLAREVGSPPDPDKAARLADRLHMRIASDGAATWSVGAEGESFPESQLRVWYAADGVEASKFHGFQRFRIALDDGSSLVFDILPTPEERSEFRWLFRLALAITGLAMLAAYGAMRWLLKPVRWLTEAAAAIRDGDLGRRAPERRGGELLDLSRTFNQMAAGAQRLLSAQQRLLLDVGHELRTPITRMKLRLEMPPDQTKTEAMREDLREMESLISSILDAARLRHEAGALKRAETDLTALLSEVAAQYSERKPRLTERLPEEPLLAEIDSKKIAVVVRNLLDNALKYSEESASPVELSIEAKAGLAIIVVRDHGVGIPAEAMPHLFQPFYRVDESRTRATGGFGLGLSLCQAIIDAHGGRITVESAPGQGATFTVELPVKTVQAPAL